MKKSRKILSIILAVMMIITAVPLTASAETYSGTCGENLTWEFDESTGTLTISGTGAMNDYEYNNRPWEGFYYNIEKIVLQSGVASISQNAFHSCHNLSIVTIPDTVRFIGSSAFSSCNSIESITIPDSVKLIGDGAFSNCYCLTSITIPDSVVTIGDSAFYDCDSLTNVTIGNSVATIGSYAFQSCDSLTSIIIPDNVISIGNGAVSECTNIKTVHIGKNVEMIGSVAKGSYYHVFYNCTSIVSFAVDEENQHYSNDEYGVLFNKDKTVLCSYPAGNERKSYSIPGTVEMIAIDGFSYSKNLEEVVIPDSVTELGCSQMEPYTYMSGAVFKYCSSLKTIIIPNGVSYIYNYTFAGCTALESITIPDGVKSIGEYAFKDCLELSDVYYTDTEEFWNKINIQIGNEWLTIADHHYESEHSHSYGEWMVMIEPTATKDGLEGRYCTACGEEETRPIPKYSHAGDVNGDGKISAVDARMILQITAGLRECDNEYFDMADVNGDGKISSIDARIVLMIVTGLM